MKKKVIRLTESDLHRIIKESVIKLIKEESIYNGYDSTTTNSYNQKEKSNRKLILQSGEEIDDNYDENYLTSFIRFGHDSFAISNIDSKLFYWAETKNGKEIWIELPKEEQMKLFKNSDFRKWFDGST